MYDFFRTQRIKFAFKKNKRKRAFRNLETMERVLMLFDYKDWMQIQLVANDLERNGIKVILWTVESLDASTINIRIPLEMRVLKHEEDESKAKCLKSATEKEFKDLKYDTLIDFCDPTIEQDSLFTYLLALNSAEFCIGNKPNQDEENKIYDLVIIQKEGKGILETFGQLKVYLKNIIP